MQATAITYGESEEREMEMDPNLWTLSNESVLSP